MEGIVINFRRGKHTQRNNQLIIKIDSKGLVGKKVKIKVGNKIFVGKLVKELDGKYIARFKKGLDGKVIGKRVEII